MEIHLIRHTTPSIEKGICYGQADVPLASDFEKEWHRIKLNLPQHVDVVFSSPLQRCKILADKISTHFHVPIHEDERLKELNFGDWELIPWNNVDSTQLNNWMQDYVFAQPPNGESYSDLAARANAFLEELKNKPVSSALIVTHHGIIKAMYSILTNISLKEAMNYKLEFGQIEKFELH